MQKLFLIDAYALIFRSYYAFISRPMRNADGLNTSAIFGFIKFVNELIRREQPHYLGVAFDPRGGNFRHELYPEYKANRDATPEDIISAIPYIKRFLEAMQVPVLEVAGYEADDVIGTLSVKASDAGFEVFMVTPDKDYGQLIRPTVHIYKQRKGGEGIEIVGYDKIKDYYGIDDPLQVIDILALWGDASDNIPGVPGIGEKSAIKLIGEFGSVENLLKNTDKLTPKQRDNVSMLHDQILLAKKLATIDLNVPVEFDPNKLVMESADIEMLADLYRELGFRSFLNEIENGRYVIHAAQSAMQSSLSSSVGLPQGKGAAVHDTLSSIEGDAPTVQRDLFGVTVTSPVNGFLQPQVGLFDAPLYQTIDSCEHKYTTITDEVALDELCVMLKGVDAFCFDTETTGLDSFTSQVVGISIAVRPFEAWYIACNRSNMVQVAQRLRPIFEDENIAKIGQNIKFDLMMMRSIGVETKGRLYDTMIIHYLLNPEARHNMDYLSRNYLNYMPIAIDALIGSGARQITMDMVPVEKVSVYSCEDADVTLRLKEVLWLELEQANLTELYFKIEEPLIRVLADIEMAGVKIDSEALASLGTVLGSEIAALESSIREMVGDPLLNVNSAKQLGEALFERLKIDAKPRMTKTKQYSTDEEYLQMLFDRHPVVGLILEYRGLRKLLSTYVEALPQLVNPVTGNIHTSFNQAVTSTGRLSSTNPNLQNIPIRDERGLEIRRAFIPSSPEYMLLSADYSQVELRLMAHLSGDQSMIEAFANGEDIHTATAAKIFSVAEAEVTRDQRRKAKTANFGIIYGISAFGLAQRLTISRSEAKEIIDGYFASYQGVKDYMEDVVARAREDGYVTTLFGRKRMLSDIRSGNAVVRGLSERNAINAPIQGGAADIMKLAMIAVHKELIDRGMKSKIILQVHDEIIIDTLRSEQNEVRELVVRCMESAAQLRVPLVVDCGSGDNWVEAH